MKREFGKKIMVFAVLAVALASVLTACGSSKIEKQEEGSYSLVLGASGDSALTNPLVQLADEKGYFKDYGLTISTVKLENAGAVMYDSLSIGKIDTAYAQMIPPISYGAQGYDVTLIGGVLSGGMVAVTRPELYDELVDLNNWEGHTIGVIQMSTSEMVTRYVLENEYGYDLDADLTYTMIEDYPSISLGVEKGNIDIGFISSTYVEGAIDEGLVVLTYLDDIMKNYVCCRQSAYSKNLEVNREAYVAYLKGQIKAYKDINDDEEGTTKSLSAATGETEDYIYNYVYDYDASAHRTYNPDPNYNGCNAIYKTLLEWKYVESDLELSDFYDLSVYADALKEIIEENPDDDFYKDMWEFFKENNNEYPDFNSLYGEDFISFD